MCRIHGRKKRPLSWSASSKKRSRKTLKFCSFFTSFLNGKTKKGVFLFFCFVQERLDWGFQNKKLRVVGKPAREKTNVLKISAGYFLFLLGLSCTKIQEPALVSWRDFCQRVFFSLKCLESAVTAFFSRENQLFRQVWLAAAVRHPKQAIGLLKSNNSNTNLVLVQVV